MVFARGQTHVISHAQIPIALAGSLVLRFIKGVCADAPRVLVDPVKMLCLVFTALLDAVCPVEAEERARALVLVLAVW